MLERRDGRWARLPHADLQWRMGWGERMRKIMRRVRDGRAQLPVALDFGQLVAGYCLRRFRPTGGRQPDEDACRKIVAYIAAPIASASCGPIGLAKK